MTPQRLQVNIAITSGQCYYRGIHRNLVTELAWANRGVSKKMWYMYILEVHKIISFAKNNAAGEYRIEEIKSYSKRQI